MVKTARIAAAAKIDPSYSPNDANAQFLEPTRVPSPNSISIGSVVRARLTLMITTQTDHGTSRHA